MERGRRILALGLLSCSFVFALSGGAQLQDPAWPMYGHDSRHTGQGQYASTGAPGLSWSFTLRYAATMTTSYPAIDSDGRVYIGLGSSVGGDKLFCVNPDCTLAWSYQTSNAILSCPAIDSDGRIYFSADGVSGDLYAMDSDGSLLWTYEMYNTAYYCPPTLGASGEIYIAEAAYLGRLDPSGSLVWSYYFDVSPTDVAPAMGSDGRVYVLTSGDSKLYSITSLGALSWSYAESGVCHGALSIDSRGKICYGALDNILYSLNSNGSLFWSYETGDYISNTSAAMGSNGRIYVGSWENNVYSLN